MDKTWRPQRVALAFTNVSPDQGSEAQNRHILSCLRANNLLSRVQTITADNGAHLRTDKLSDLIFAEDREAIRKPRITFIRCMAHIFNLIVQEIMSPIKLNNYDASIQANNESFSSTRDPRLEYDLDQDDIILHDQILAASGSIAASILRVYLY